MSESHDNLFVCYNTQNYLKALYLSYLEHEAGRTSSILALVNEEAASPSFFDTRLVTWAVVEYWVNTNPYIRILESDKRHPLILLKKVVQKAYLKAHRTLMKSGERKQLLEALAGSEKVHIFLERTYFSHHILKHRKCVLIEEGLASYRPYPIRLLSPFSERFPGGHQGIQEVLLQHPERAEGSVRAKAKLLELNYAALPREVKSALLAVFGLEEFQRDDRSAIIVGQAWGQSSVEFAETAELYDLVARWLESRSYTVYLKPHPSEELAKYEALNCRILDPLIPIEAFELIEGEYAFDCAVSVLRSSLTNSPRLARSVLSLVRQEILVEELSPSILNEMKLRASTDLAAALDSPHDLLQPSPACAAPGPDGSECETPRSLGLDTRYAPAPRAPQPGPDSP